MKKDQEFLALKERLEVLFGIRGNSLDRAVRLRELNALIGRFPRLLSESDSLDSRVTTLRSDYDLLDGRVTTLRSETVDRDSGWQTPTLLNGWVNFLAGNQSARYRRLSSGLVVIEGVIKSGNQLDGTPLFTLPAGFRPSGDILFAASSGSQPAGLTVRPFGDVVTGYNVSPSWLSITISFYASQ